MLGFLGLPQLLGISIGAEKTEWTRALGNLGLSLLYLPSATYHMGMWSRVYY